MPKTRDPVWANYECIRTKNSGLWAKCRKCGKEMQGIPHRLKKHLSVCRPTSVPEPNFMASLTQVKFLPQSPATCRANEQSKLVDYRRPQSSTKPEAMQMRWPPSPLPPPIGHRNHTPHETQQQNCHFTPVLCAREVPSRSWRPNSAAKQHGGSTATKSNQSNDNSTHLTITKNADVTTTKDYEEKINLQIAKYFYTSNTAFNHVENGEFIKLCSLLRPDYKPPTAYQIGNLILNKVLTEAMTQVKKEI